MYKISQRGFISQTLLLLLIIASLGAGSYLVSHKVKELPLVGQSGRRVPETGFILKPENFSKSKGVKDQIRVDLLVHSDIDESNLFAARISFPNDLLEVTGLETGQKEKQLISFWADKSFNNSTGKISLIGGIPTPGLKTKVDNSDPVMATITFKPKKEGSPIISFEDSSAIYRNSDNQNILVIKNSLELNITKLKPSENLHASPSAKLKNNPNMASISASPETPKKRLRGDGNGDSKIDLSDISIFFSHLNQPTGEHPELDFNNDGKINAFDSSSMLQLIFSKP